MELWKFRHQAKRDNWADIQQSYEKQIDSVEKRGNNQEEANRLRLEYEAQQEAYRAQQGVESLAPRSIAPDRPTTRAVAEVEHLRALLAESRVLNPAALAAEGHWLRGNAHYESGDFRQAVDSYTVALRLRPDYPEAYSNRGVAYGGLGEHQRAIEDYTEALRLRPDFPEAYYNRACAYSLAEDIEPCVANLERAVALDESLKEQGRSNPDLEWARQDPRVRKLLEME